MEKPGLNSQQKEAANHFEGPCVVLACPGSGKTHTIVERLAFLIDKGVSPSNILSITFTNKAAGEMKDRALKRIGPEAKSITISTFHALCASILRKMGSSIGYSNKATILDEDDQSSLMAQVCRQAGYELDSARIDYLCQKVNTLREEVIPEEEWKNHVKENFESTLLINYVERIRIENSLDFSSLLSETLRLLRTDKEVLNKLSSKWKFIQVDESQDTNYAQFQIFLEIGSSNNLFIVGDTDQSVYSWRGARYANIKDFIDIKKSKIIVLPKNYRSTPEIISVAGNLIKFNKNRPHQFAFETDNDNGEPVEVYGLVNDTAEGIWIANRIREYIYNHGYKPKDIAVLYRMNSMSANIEKALMNEGIKYKIIGGMSFYDRMEVRDSHAMLRFFVNNNDSSALCRFINSPKRSIGEVAIGKIENYAKSNNITLKEALGQAQNIFPSTKSKIVKECQKIASVFDYQPIEGEDIGSVMEYLVKNLDYEDHIKDPKYKDSCQDRFDNLSELYKNALLYSKQNGNDISGYLQMIMLMSSVDKKTDDNAVTLMTLHASKGLEFPIVFMPCLNQNLIPHSRAVSEREDGLEEERRLCYVGMTRAEKILLLSYHIKEIDRRMSKQQKGLVYKKAEVSQFIMEAGFDASMIRFGEEYYA